jgi:hypothetical protein
MRAAWDVAGYLNGVLSVKRRQQGDIQVLRGLQAADWPTSRQLPRFLSRHAAAGQQRWPTGRRGASFMAMFASAWAHARARYSAARLQTVLLFSQILHARLRRSPGARTISGN